MTGRLNERPVIDVLRELDAVQRELRATPSDAWERRQDLHDREDSLREELRAAGRCFDARASIQQLKRRIAELERRIEAHFAGRLSYASGGQGGPGGGGIDPQWLHKWHRLMDRSADLVGMRAELQDLRAELARLENGFG